MQHVSSKKERRSERKNDGTCLSVVFTDPMTSLYPQPPHPFLLSFRPPTQNVHPKYKTPGRCPGGNDVQLTTSWSKPNKHCHTKSMPPKYGRDPLMTLCLVAEQYRSICSHRKKTPLILSALADVFHCTRTSAVVRTIHAIVQYCKNRGAVLRHDRLF